MKTFLPGTFLFLLLVFPVSNTSAHPEFSLNGKSNAGRKNTSTGIGLALANIAIPTYLGGRMVHAESNESLGMFLLGYGVLLGPSMGNFYAADYKRTITGATIRLALGLLASAVTTSGTWDENGSSQEETILLFSLLGSVATAVWNIATVPTSVREYNRKHQQNFGLQPVVNPHSGEFAMRFFLLF